MRLLQFVLAVAASLWALPLHAQPEPRVAPAPAWVTPVAIPTANATLRDRPFQALLLNSQVRFERESQSVYSEMAFLIQNAQGMQGLGTIALPWRPDQSELIIHHAH